MDPLSITASVIAVVQLAAAVGKGFRLLLDAHGSSDQLLQIMNEVCHPRASVLSRVLAN